MSCYPRGKEPPCPGGYDDCTTKLRERGAKLCANCERKSRIKTLPPPTGESTRYSGNVCELSRVVGERIKSLQDLIRVCEIDTSEWEVERFVCNKWEGFSVPRAVGNKQEGWSRESTEPVVTPLFQVKAWLKRKVGIIAARAELADLKKDAALSMPRRPAVKVPSVKTGTMLEISIPDLHAGKLAWDKETGHANYDTRIAEKVYEDALSALLARTASHRFERIVYVLGNDCFNGDNKQGTTTAGTPQDTDGRFQKTFSVVRRMMCRTIDRLRSLSPSVHVLMVPGNHDTLAVWHLGDSLECYFNRTPGVFVDNAPTQRKYFQHGAVMLMFTHGDKGKFKDYPLLMATEQPKMFGETIHREAHTGHRHHAQLDEYHGVRVRMSPALCAVDAWHSEQTHVGAQRAAEAFVWDAVEGQIASATYTVPRDEITKERKSA